MTEAEKILQQRRTLCISNFLRAQLKYNKPHFCWYPEQSSPQHWELPVAIYCYNWYATLKDDTAHRSKRAKECCSVVLRGPGCSLGEMRATSKADIFVFFCTDLIGAEMWHSVFTLEMGSSGRASCLIQTHSQKHPIQFCRRSWIPPYRSPKQCCWSMAAGCH